MAQVFEVLPRMNFYPTSSDSVLLLERAGFTHTGPGSGWEKGSDAFRVLGLLKKKTTKFRRVHAIIKDGYIHVHADKELETGKHKAFSQHALARETVKLLERLDAELAKTS